MILWTLLLLLSGCMNSLIQELYYIPPDDRFKYGVCVWIMEGFYEGQTGTLVGIRNFSSIYTIAIQCDKPCKPVYVLMKKDELVILHRSECESNK